MTSAASPLAGVGTVTGWPSMLNRTFWMPGRPVAVMTSWATASWRDGPTTRLNRPERSTARVLPLRALVRLADRTSVPVGTALEAPFTPTSGGRSRTSASSTVRGCWSGSSRVTGTTVPLRVT